MTGLRLNSCTSGNSSVRVTSSSRGTIVRIGIDQTLSRHERDATAPELIDEGARNRWRQRRRGRCRKVNDGPVLGDGVDEMKVARHSSELGEDAPGDEKDEDASRPQRSNRVSHRFVSAVPIRNRTVVVERDGCELHGVPSCISGCKAEPRLGGRPVCAAALAA